MTLEKTDLEAVATTLRLVFDRLDSQRWKAFLSPDEMNELEFVTQLVEKEVDNINS